MYSNARPLREINGRSARNKIKLLYASMID
jgi:hypothetical protein